MTLLRNKRFKIIVAILLLLIVSVSITSAIIYTSNSEENQPASFSQIESYGTTLIEDYHERLSYFMPDTFNQFAFYSNSCYTITAYKSTNFLDTAIEIEPNGEGLLYFNDVETDTKVENLLFFGNESTWTMTMTAHAERHPATILWNEHVESANLFHMGFLVEKDVSLIIKNLDINQPLFTRHFHCLILKGSNQTSAWSESAAIEDSKKIFNYDLYKALNQSEEVRQRYAEPELNKLLLDIIGKWEASIKTDSEVEYTYTQKEYDLKQVEDIAKNKYGITNSSQFVNNLLEYLKQASLPENNTVFGINDPENWIFTIIAGLEPTGIVIITSLSDKILKNTKIKQYKTALTGIFSTTLVLGLIAAFFSYPSDFNWLSIQPIIIALMWLASFLILIKVQKKIGWLRVIESENNDDKKHSQKETKNTSKPKKNKDA
jgi:hypothetical protein